MSKYLIAASYTPEGFKGLVKDKAAARLQAVSDALAAVGGKLESFYFALGEADVFVIADCPDNLTAARLSVAVCASGLVRTRTVPLFSVEEAHQFLSKPVPFRAPGA